MQRNNVKEVKEKEDQQKVSESTASFFIRIPKRQRPQLVRQDAIRNLPKFIPK